MTSNTKIVSYQEAAKYGVNAIVKTGCFDIFHVGHLKMFERCKEIADILIVFVGSDEVLKILYSNSPKSKAFFDENNRAEVIASLSCVDYVCILTEPTHHYALSIIRPKYYHIPNDDKWPQDKRKMCEDLGIELIIDSNTEILNYGVIFEPHTTQIKNDKFITPIA